MKTAMLIGGTWSWSDFLRPAPVEWYRAGAFVDFLGGELVRIIGERDPFVWASDVNFGKGKRRDWSAAGRNLHQYLRPPVLTDDRDRYVPIGQRNLIAHSHGGQVVFYALADGLIINNLITVATPVLKPIIEDVLPFAAPRIRGRWLHLSTDWRDRMQWFGELFDGAFGIQRAFPAVCGTKGALIGIPNLTNEPVPGWGHSSFLKDPRAFPLWRSRGWLDYLDAVA